LRRAAAEIDHPRHGLAPSDQIGDAKLASGRGFHTVDLALQRVDLERVLDGHLEPLRAYRLHDKVDRAAAHGGHGRIDIAVGDLHDGRIFARQGAHGGQHGHSARAGHDEIEQDQRDVA
jgi:hypothetical protein